MTFALLKHPNLQVRTFINGVIYSLLDNNALRSLAKELCLKDKLLHILNECGENELQK